MGTTANGETVATTGTTTLGNTTGSPAVQQTGKIVKGGGAGTSSAANKNSRAGCTKEGHPVDVVTGEVVDEILDLETPGIFDVEWRRLYSSGFADESTPLGRGGWTFTLHQWIDTDQGFPNLRDADGRNVDFAPVGADGRSFDRPKRLDLMTSGQSFEVWSIERRMLRVFSPAVPGGRALLREVRDARGNAARLEYDGERLVKVIDTAAREYRLRHDHVGRIVEVAIWARGAQQQTVHYTYTDAGELASATDALGRTQHYAYDGWHRMIRTTLANGLSFHYEYDVDSGRCIKTWGDGGLFTVVFDFDDDDRTTTTSGNPTPKKYTYGPKNEILREESIDGAVVWEREYDDDLLVVVERNGAGEEIQNEYDARGNLVATTDALGRTTRYEHSADWHVRTLSDGMAWTIERNRFGDVEGVVTPTGWWTRATYDGRGRLTQVYTSEGELAHAEFDDDHNRILVRNFRGGVKRYTFDALGRELTRTDAIGRTSRITYDAVGQMVSIVGEDGRTTELAWDRLGYLTKQVNGLGQVTTFEYGGMGGLLRMTLPDGQAWGFEYDKNQRVVGMENPKRERLEYRYDRAGRVEEERTFDGRVLRYAYDAGSRLSAIEQPDGTFVRFAYDAGGNVVEESSADAIVTWERDDSGLLVRTCVDEVAAQIVVEYEYDAFGRVVRERQNGHLIERELDLRGWCVARTIDGVSTTRYAYSPYRELESVVHDGFELRVQRDALGREVRRFEGNGRFDIQTKYGPHDELAAQRVVVPSRKSPGQFDELLSLTWEYDGLGQLIRASDSRRAPVAYRHDLEGRLLDRIQGTAQESFDYDAAGALVARLDAASTRRGTWASRMGGVIVRTDEAEYEHDEQGRRVAVRAVDADGEPTREETRYRWDARGNLREVLKPDGERIRFFYDAMRRRVRKEVHPAPAGDAQQPSRATDFVWDDLWLCAEVDPIRGRRSHVFVPETWTPLLQGQDGEVFSVLSDQVGGVRDLLDSQGRIAWSIDLNPWGDARPQAADPSAALAGIVESPFRMPGQYWDPETGLAYVHHRHWDPATGRFLSPDPIGIDGGENLFGLDGSPLDDVDPTGVAKPYSIGTYGTQTGGTNVGDKMDADEMLLNAFIDNNQAGLKAGNTYGGRGSGNASRDNPTIALPGRAPYPGGVHDQICDAERAAGLHDPANLQKWTAKQVIDKKARILLKVLKANGMKKKDAEKKVKALKKAAIAHAKKIFRACVHGF